MSFRLNDELKFRVRKSVTDGWFDKQSCCSCHGFTNFFISKDKKVYEGSNCPLEKTKEIHWESVYAYCEDKQDTAEDYFHFKGLILGMCNQQPQKKPQTQTFEWL